MNFNDYQSVAKSTAVYPDEYKVIYPALGLNGEAGEIAEKVKKIIRDKSGMTSPTDRLGIIHELGDVLWYVAALASDMGIKLDEVAALNRRKLEARKEKGTLHGSGDNR